MKENYLLEVKDLQIGFPSRKHKYKKTEDKSQHGSRQDELVVNRISFSLEAGEIIGIVGESGSGKTMTALSLIGLLPKQARITKGSIYFDGQNLLDYNENQLLEIKGDGISMIFQDPMTSLNPVLRVGRQVEEMLVNHRSLKKEEIKEQTLKMFEEVGLSNLEELYEKYPHQLSGGMRQRVMIAMAMICKPKLMIADEPTTALDITVQAQILKLIKKLNKEYGTSVILISHDLGVVKSICKRALVMCEGKIVEEGPIEELFYQPQQEYTKQLINAVPSFSHRRIKKPEKLIKIDLKQQTLPKEQKGQKEQKEIILQINKLNAFYEVKQHKLWAKPKRNSVLKDISFEMIKGEILGIVGESGCGKSTLAKVIAGLHKDITGEIKLNGRKPQMVFQDSYGSLNPAKMVHWILEEPLKIKGGYSKKQRKEAVDDMLQQVGLKKEYGKRYLSELSGGQRQRVSIANSLMLQSEFIILDEPVSALDVTVQAQILDLLLELREKHNLTYLFISHDLNVVGQICDRICVMHQGEIVENAFVEQLYRNPTHAYSKMLLGAIPSIDLW